MEVDEVPQEGNKTLGAHRKAVYARNPDGDMVIVASRGSAVDETVTLQAVDRMNAQTEAARLRVVSGESSPLEYWMYRRRMDVALLAQVSGIWAWRIRRHFHPARFQKLPERVLARYAEALGISIEQLRSLPQP